MSASIILYPPIVNSWEPSFIYNTNPRIWFSISPYNDFNEIQYAQIVCSQQSTNLTQFNKTLVPASIYMIPKANIGIDNTVSGDMKYYIDIPTTVIRDNIFPINQYYKVQIRFASTEASSWDGQQSSVYTWNNATALDPNTTNLECLSEWSRVCLLKPIAQPTFIWKQTTFEEQLIEMDGKLKFAAVTIDGKPVEEKEILDHYYFELVGTNYKTDTIYVNSEDPNEVFCPIEYLFGTGSYTLKFTYYTNNGYTNTENVAISITIDSSLGWLDPVNLYVLPDEEQSRICLWITTDTKTISPDNQSVFAEESNNYTPLGDVLLQAYNRYNTQQFPTIPSSGTIYYLAIVRASNEDGYMKWTDIHTMHIGNTSAAYAQANFVYYDNTAESGVLYKYAIQNRNSLGKRSSLIYEVHEQTPPAHGKMIVPEFIRLVDQNKQLTLSFDGAIASPKYNVSENSSETIGSQFPFVMRNGNVKYRTFNISAKISTLIDWERGEVWDAEHQTFLKNIYEQQKEDFYGSDFDDYNQYNLNNNIPIDRDRVYEKKYRDKVLEFLLNGRPKLFKSADEGNILVYLTNVSLNPEKTANFVYTIQATATEIALCNVKNYEKHGIIEKIEYYN